MTRLLSCTFPALDVGAIGFAAFERSVAEQRVTPPPPDEKQSRWVEKHHKTFDTLDFDVFSRQTSARLHESHAADRFVAWPDGDETDGIDRPIDDLTGTFTKPMPPDGASIAPTGQRFAIGMATIARWKGKTWTMSGCTGTTRTS